MAVLVTRPDERGKALVDQLNQAGVVALHLPLLSIEAGAELAQLPTKLNQLKSGDYVDIERHSIFPVKLNVLFVIQSRRKILKAY